MKPLYQVQLLPPDEVTAEVHLRTWTTSRTFLQHPTPATFHGPSQPNIALETGTIPQTSSNSHGIQELSVEIGGDLVIIFTDEGAGRQSEHSLRSRLHEELNHSYGSQKP